MFILYWLRQELRDMSESAYLNGCLFGMCPPVVMLAHMLGRRMGKPESARGKLFYCLHERCPLVLVKDKFRGHIDVVRCRAGHLHCIGCNHLVCIPEFDRMLRDFRMGGFMGAQSATFLLLHMGFLFSILCGVLSAVACMWCTHPDRLSQSPFDET